MITNVLRDVQTKYGSDVNIVTGRNVNMNDGCNSSSSSSSSRRRRKSKGIVSDVVVAYLSANSPDLLLSVLGCTDSTFTNTTTVADDDSSSNRTTHDEAIMSLSVSTPIVAMCNTRWSSRDITTALRLRYDDKDSDDDSHNK